MRPSAAMRPQIVSSLSRKRPTPWITPKGTGTEAAPVVTRLVQGSLARPRRGSMSPERQRLLRAAATSPGPRATAGSSSFTPTKAVSPSRGGVEGMSVRTFGRLERGRGGRGSGRLAFDVVFPEGPAEGHDHGREARRHVLEFNGLAVRRDRGERGAGDGERVAQELGDEAGAEFDQGLFHLRKCLATTRNTAQPPAMTEPSAAATHLRVAMVALAVVRSSRIFWTSSRRMVRSASSSRWTASILTVVAVLRRVSVQAWVSSLTDSLSSRRSSETVRRQRSLSFSRWALMLSRFSRPAGAAS